MYRILIIGILFFIYSSSANASEWGRDGFTVTETRVAFRGVGEAWKDANIGTVYRSSRFFGFLGMGYRFHKHYAATVEGGFVRVDGNNKASALQIIPVSFGGNVLFPAKGVEPFVGTGISLVNFLETGGETPISGTKMGMDFRAGVRISTNFARPSLHPNRADGLNKFDIELMLGQRFHQMFGVGTGLNMGATRLGVGMLLRF